MHVNNALPWSCAALTKPQSHFFVIPKATVPFMPHWGAYIHILHIPHTTYHYQLYWLTYDASPTPPFLKMARMLHTHTARHTCSIRTFLHMKLNHIPIAERGAHLVWYGGSTAVSYEPYEHRRTHPDRHFILLRLQPSYILPSPQLLSTLFHHFVARLALQQQHAAALPPRLMFAPLGLTLHSPPLSLANPIAAMPCAHHAYVISSPIRPWKTSSSELPFRLPWHVYTIALSTNATRWETPAYYIDTTGQIHSHPIRTRVIELSNLGAITSVTLTITIAERRRTRQSCTMGSASRVTQGVQCPFWLTAPR